jgi:hypothetical protein
MGQLSLEQNMEVDPEQNLMPDPTRMEEVDHAGDGAASNDQIAHNPVDSPEGLDHHDNSSTAEDCGHILLADDPALEDLFIRKVGVREHPELCS